MMEVVQVLVRSYRTKAQTGGSCTKVVDRCKRCLYDQTIKCMVYGAHGRHIYTSIYMAKCCSIIIHGTIIDKFGWLHPPKLRLTFFLFVFFNGQSNTFCCMIHAEQQTPRSLLLNDDHIPLQPSNTKLHVGLRTLQSVVVGKGRGN